MVPYFNSQSINLFICPSAFPFQNSHLHKSMYIQKWLCLQRNNLPWSDPEHCSVPWIIEGNQKIVFMLKTYVNNWSKLSGSHPILHSWTIHETLNPCIPLQNILFTQQNSKCTHVNMAVFVIIFQKFKRQRELYSLHINMLFLVHQ